MLIRKVGQGVYDVFGDVGFDNWTRVRKYHWGLKGVAGNFLPRELMREVAATIDQNPQGSIDNVTYVEQDETLSWKTLPAKLEAITPVVKKEEHVH